MGDLMTDTGLFRLPSDLLDQHGAQFLDDMLVEQQMRDADAITSRVTLSNVEAVRARLRKLLGDYDVPPLSAA